MIVRIFAIIMLLNAATIINKQDMIESSCKCNENVTEFLTGVADDLDLITRAFDSTEDKVKEMGKLRHVFGLHPKTHPLIYNYTYEENKAIAMGELHHVFGLQPENYPFDYAEIYTEKMGHLGIALKSYINTIKYIARVYRGMVDLRAAIIGGRVGVYSSTIFIRKKAFSLMSIVSSSYSINVFFPAHSVYAEMADLLVNLKRYLEPFFTANYADMDAIIARIDRYIEAISSIASADAAVSAFLAALNEGPFEHNENVIIIINYFLTHTRLDRKINSSIAAGDVNAVVLKRVLKFHPGNLGNPSSPNSLDKYIIVFRDAFNQYAKDVVSDDENIAILRAAFNLLPRNFSNA